jgi:hypothetical protein
MKRVLLVLPLALCVVACNELLNDSSFQLWCDDSPCEWDVEAGAVSQAPTWHEQDFGVSLDEDPTAISQLVPKRRLAGSTAPPSARTSSTSVYPLAPSSSVSVS